MRERKAMQRTETMRKGRVLMREMNSAVLMKTSDLLAAGNLPFKLFFEDLPLQIMFFKTAKISSLVY